MTQYHIWQDRWFLLPLHFLHDNFPCFQNELNNEGIFQFLTEEQSRLANTEYHLDHKSQQPSDSIQTNYQMYFHLRFEAKYFR
ncbi:hypothetical protein D3C80_1976840 [compost metagenome]